MKKLIATLALCLGTAAFAQNDNKQPQEPQQPPSAGQRQGPTLFEADELNAQERLEQEQAQAEGGAGMDQEKQQEQALFKKGTKSFELRGNLENTSEDSITIQRAEPNMPPVKMDVKEQTVVMLDGKKVKPDELPQGVSVRASFQVANDNILAVRIEASSKGQKMKQRQPATGGAGQQDSYGHPEGMKHDDMKK